MKPILIIQNCPAESPGTIIDYCNDNGIGYERIHSYVNDRFPSLDSVDAVINLGCPYSAATHHEHDFLVKLYAYVAEIVRQNKPYLGICFGGQILAKVLGAKVEPNKVKEIGTYSISLTEDGMIDPIFNELPSSFDVFQWHGDTFRIPFEAKLLATGVDCVNQAFRKNNAVGIQFHFEAHPDEIPHWCDTYADELAEFGKSKDEIVSTYRNKFDTIRSDHYRFMDNFLSL